MGYFPGYFSTLQGKFSPKFISPAPFLSSFSKIHSLFPHFGILSLFCQSESSILMTFPTSCIVHKSLWAGDINRNWGKEVIGKIPPLFQILKTFMSSKCSQSAPRDSKIVAKNQEKKDGKNQKEKWEKENIREKVKDQEVDLFLSFWFWFCVCLLVFFYFCLFVFVFIFIFDQKTTKLTRNGLKDFLLVCINARIAIFHFSH